MNIGPYQLDGQVLLAPMAGTSDQPFRRLCREQGAALATTEMLHADQRLWQTRKSSSRLKVEADAGLVSMQIAGACPAMLADAARGCVDLGAQIVDINMGCPAKKVCNALAGSALLTDPPLVAQILNAVVAAVDIPVTLKIRTGPAPDCRNAVLIARIAEQAGIQALAIHGRTRADRFKGHAEYDTIAEVKHSVSIPVIANGDITSARQAQQVLHQTHADAVMIGRAAQGNPWIFAQIQHFLTTGKELPAPAVSDLQHTLIRHLGMLASFYGELMGPRIGRKHIGWYLTAVTNGEHLRRQLMPLTTFADQRQLIERWFHHHQPQLRQAA